MPVTRANLAKNHSAKAFRKSGVICSSSSSILLLLIKALNRKKFLIIIISRSGNPSSKRLGFIILGISIADWLLILRSPALKRLYSKEAIYLLDIINIIFKREQFIILYVFIVIF